MGQSENRIGAEVGVLRRRRKTEGSPETQNADIAPATVAGSKEQLPYSINPEAEVKGKRTLRLVLDENGNIDGSMRDKSVDDLRRAIENPAVKARLQPEEKKETKQKHAFVTPEACRQPWAFLGMGFGQLVSGAMKIPKENRLIVGMICAYQPQELDTLSRLSADCLNFYADKLPAWIWDMIEQTTGPLAQLIEAVLSIHYVKYVTLKAALANPQEFMESVKANGATRESVQ